MPENPSRDYTIRMSPGTHDVLAKMVARVAATKRLAEQADTCEDAVAILRDASDQAVNLLAQLTRATYPSVGDGNVNLFPDPAPESLGFRWDSGYTGAVILHQSHDQRQARWSTHT